MQLHSPILESYHSCFVVYFFFSFLLGFDGLKIRKAQGRSFCPKSTIGRTRVLLGLYKTQRNSRLSDYRSLGADGEELNGHVHPERVSGLPRHVAFFRMLEIGNGGSEHD